ncbi:MAG: ParB/RepB/Spo0J family partition protein [Actinomycetota bacterium]|nr:ParB/RepB/Spo0J family partition protein [Actinomycetota bacterium]
MTRRGLGRGLDALLPTSPEPDDRTPSGAGLFELPIDAIEANPRQPRRNFDEGSLDELAASMTTLGVLQPLLVRAVGRDRYELIAGERRLRAARRVGLTRVPVVVLETDERGSLERALVENVHRADLNPMEEAAALRQLIDEGGLTQDELGERLGRNRVTVANTLRLLELPLPVQQLIVGGRLSAGHGKALLGLAGNPFMERLARRAADEGWSTRETEEQVRRYQAMSGAVPRARRDEGSQPAAATEAQHRLAHHLQTRVRVEMGKRKGRVVLDFVSLEELDRIARIILGEADGSAPRSVDRHGLSS